MPLVVRKRPLLYLTLSNDPSDNELGDHDRKGKDVVDKGKRTSGSLITLPPYKCP